MSFKTVINPFFIMHPYIILVSLKQQTYSTQLMFWYEDEIKALHLKGLHLKSKPRTIFYGSSTLRLWEDAEETFRIYDPINLAFGGSTMAACTWYFDSVFEPFDPESIIIYAGDNDLANNRHPEEVVLFLGKWGRGE